MARILVIDNDDTVRALWITVLTHEGHEVIPAREGAVGLQQYKQHTPELVVTDLDLPELHGLALIAWLRATHSGARIIAASGNDEALRLAARLGAAITLRKPVGISALAAAVRWTLRERASTPPAVRFPFP